MLHIQIFAPVRLLWKRDHRKLMIDLHEEAGQRIKTLILPHKFTAELFRRYPNIARKRTTKYQTWKWRQLKKGNISEYNPNVLSGTLKWEATVNARVTRTSSHTRVYIKTGTGKFVTGPRRGQTYSRALKDWQRDELEYLSDDDIKGLAEWIGFMYVNEALRSKYEGVQRRGVVSDFV